MSNQSSAMHVEELDTPISPPEQKKLIKQLINDEKLIVGEQWYLVDFRWWKLWKQFVHYDDDDENTTKSNKGNALEVEVGSPDKIDNSNLIQMEDGAAKPSKANFVKLKPNLQEDEDYVLISKPVWRYLFEWYKGGPEIVRNTIEEGKAKKCRVEVYPLLFKVTNTNPEGLPDLSTEFEVLASKKITVKELKSVICSQISFTELSKARLWSLFGTTSKLLNDESQTLEQCTLVDGQRILVETQEKDGSWIKESQNGSNNKKTKEKKKEKKKGILGYFFGGSSSSSSSNSNGNSSSNSGNSSRYGSKATVDESSRGLCGLMNLGNTCFMNSALQCLSNTAALTEYFISNTYLNEINKDNPLGMKGKIAEKYGDLIKRMWAGTHSSISPQELKFTIGKFAPQFMGSSQHDSQELLAFLLDGLHEDLNRILKKPYIEVKENEHMPEEEAAIESWEAHLKRNQSIIVDLFQGQLKSTLVCPKCQHVSKCWDPFMYLSLPLPVEPHRAVDVTVIRFTKNWETPVKYTLKINKLNGCVKDIPATLKTILPDLDPKKVLLGDVHNHRVCTYIPEDKSIWFIRGSDVTYAFELPEEAVRKENPLLRLQVVNRRERKKTGGLSFDGSVELFGVPFLMFFEKGKTTGKELYEMMWDRVKGLIQEYTSTLPASSSDHFEDAKDYPFKLAIVASNGLSCATCSTGMCSGCEIPFADVINLRRTGHTVAIDWDPKIIKKYLPKEISEKVATNEETDSKKPRNANSPIGLMECLELFTMDEKLGANDPWYCPKCKEFHQANKKFDLWKMPSVLVVHLKRFQFSKHYREKLNVNVDFPLEGLDLSSFVQTKQDIPPVYDLFAVSNHIGGMAGGHYTAYAKNKFDGNWYLFNDSTCERAQTSNIQSSSAYVLFYKRRDP